MNYAEESLKKHYEWRGKIEVVASVPVTNREELSLHIRRVLQPRVLRYKRILKNHLS